VPLLTLDPTSDPVAADPWMYARTKMIVAARAAGIDAIDGPTANIRDAESYLRAARRAAVLGAVGKWAVHPSQITLAHEAFSPSPDAVARAREVMAAFEEALAAGDGAVRVGDLMIDAASARIYQNILDFDDLILSKQNALDGSPTR
jgi:citrate lyase subunit beta / citryl-CoA lyase